MSSRLVVMTFDDESDASALLGDLRKVAHGGQLHLTDTAVVHKNIDGKVHVDSELSTGTEIGPVVGTAFGSLLFFMFPVVGTFGGAALGGWVGSKVEHGIDKEFVQEVRESLKPGGSTLCLMASSDDPEPVLVVMRHYHGEVHLRTLKLEVEQALHGSGGSTT